VVDEVEVETAPKTPPSEDVAAAAEVAAADVAAAEEVAAAALEDEVATEAAAEVAEPEPEPVRVEDQALAQLPSCHK
jgi:hypothetical protein